MIRPGTLGSRRFVVTALAASTTWMAAVAGDVVAQPPAAAPSAEPPGDDGLPPPAAPSAAAPAPAPAPAPATAAPEIEPGHAARLEKAIEARKAGQFEAALTMLRALVAEAPQLARAWHEIGVLYALHGQLDDARTAFEAALERDPTLLAARMNLAEILRAEGKFGAALPHYRTVAAAAGVDRSVQLAARKGAAISLIGLGDREGARAELTALQDADPSGEAGTWAKERLASLDADARAPADVAEADAEVERLIQTGRIREAADLAGQTCREAPSAERCYRQAVALLALRDYLGAVAALRASLQVDKAYLPALSAWPTAIRKLRGEGAQALQVPFAAPGEVATRKAARALVEGDLLLAEQTATAAMEASGPSATLLLCRAQARLLRGDHRRAVADFEALAARRPGYDLARSGQAAVAFAEGRLDVARRLAELPPAATIPVGVELPDGFDADADVRAFVLWHHDEVDHRLAMLLDPGRRPRQVRPPPPSLDVEALRPPPTAEAAPAPGRGGANPGRGAAGTKGRRAR